MYLVGFIIKKLITMYGHTNVKDFKVFPEVCSLMMSI